MSFRTLLGLRSAALHPAPAGRALKPLEPPAAANVPSSATAPYKLLPPRIGYSSAYTSPAPAPRNYRPGTGHGARLLPGAGNDGASEEIGEDGDVVIVAGEGIRGRRCPPGSRCEVRCSSEACRFYGEMYALVYVLSWMIGRVIVLAARDGRQWLRRYVRGKFSQKR